MVSDSNYVESEIVGYDVLILVLMEYGLWQLFLNFVTIENES